MTLTSKPRILAALAAALALAGCGGAEPPRETEADQARAVRVVRIEPRPITGSLSASGVLVPREEAAVAPEVSGFRVARVLAEEGDYVRRGQTLAVLDDTLLRAQIEQQAALAAQAAVQAEQAESQAARVAGLDGEGVLSAEQIETRRFQARAARATAAAPAAALRDLRARAGKLSVTAPVAGLVLERNVRPGETAAAGAAAWFRIAREGLIELEAELPEDGLSAVRAGMDATVTLPSGASVPGQVRLVSPTVDPQTKLGSVFVRLPARSDIRAGGYARATFADVSGTVLAAPETAVRYDADGASVMVVAADNRVRRVPVQTGRRGNGLVELIRGPAEGSRVVEASAAFLLDGDLIRPVEGEPAAAPQPQPKGAAR